MSHCSFLKWSGAGVVGQERVSHGWAVGPGGTDGIWVLSPHNSPMDCQFPSKCLCLLCSMGQKKLAHRISAGVDDPSQPWLERACPALPSCISPFSPWVFSSLLFAEGILAYMNNSETHWLIRITWCFRGLSPLPCVQTCC